MSGSVLTAMTSAQCPHGGQVEFLPDQVEVLAGEAPVLLATTPSVVVGCAFNVAGAPSPCVTVRWLKPAIRVSVHGTPVVLATSTGMCLNPASAPQGPVQITGAQHTVVGS